jgi:hypothetical protein
MAKPCQRLSTDMAGKSSKYYLCAVGGAIIQTLQQLLISAICLFRGYTQFELKAIHAFNVHRISKATRRYENLCGASCSTPVPRRDFAEFFRESVTNRILFILGFCILLRVLYQGYQEKTVLRNSF